MRDVTIIVLNSMVTLTTAAVIIFSAVNLRAAYQADVEQRIAAVEDLATTTKGVLSTLSDIDRKLIQRLGALERRTQLQSALHTRALIAEMGEKDYKREVDEFLAEVSENENGK